jgi:uncharacterized protein (TIGR01777 family)
MTQVLWTLLGLQLALGAFDILYHHELTERLAWRPSQQRELRLHGARNLAYAVLFAAIGWCRPLGAAALALIGLMACELVITLWDFVEEDRSRRLPPSERVTHALMALNYGALLLILVPMYARQAVAPTAIEPAYHGLASWACAVAALGVILFGLRDLGAAARLGRTTEDDPAALASALGRRRSVLVTGGTGFVGSRLVQALVAAGHDVTVLTRSQRRAEGLPSPVRSVASLAEIGAEERIDAIVNLAGEPISDGLWTARKRWRILRSRLEVTREVGRLIRRLRTAPEVLVSGSAVGWYGLRGAEALSESAGPSDCFSHQLCQRWEKAAIAAAGPKVRLVRLRIGLVLGAEGGLLSRMLTPFDFGLGMRFGSGRQWMSWIHRDDLVRLIVHAIACPYLAGRLNGTAPHPVTNAEFTAALARALHRPAILSVPAGPLRLALGSMAEEVLLGGQRVLPGRAKSSGFRFTYPELGDAMAAIIPPPHAARKGQGYAGSTRGAHLIPPPAHRA